jgi:hypothetical protein
MHELLNRLWSILAVNVLNTEKFKIYHIICFYNEASGFMYAVILLQQLLIIKIIKVVD